MEKNYKELILNTLLEKSTVKNDVFDNTFETFQLLKEVLHEITIDYNKKIIKKDKRLILEFRDTEKFEAELKIAGDILFFHMHTNVFEFDRNHGVWKISYVQDDKMTSYSGIINVYNFLSDSFKYNRYDDLGYLIARIFINKDKNYFVEGKRQLGFLYNNFGQESITKESLRKIIESAILYTLDFDLLVPPYDNVKIATVAQMLERKNNAKISTGKRLGFKFYADDVSVK
ncbi:MAG TPA: hypothetical protein DDX39_08095 [Bacteroidales bacterium]|nr:MAG: hypothetical protein A2W98_14860 [Bacteroidetes bacterium GWF2_33_38]HBF88588.1 hypothetical protein [Bacteroidales bacterium]